MLSPDKARVYHNLKSRAEQILNLLRCILRVLVTLTTRPVTFLTAHSSKPHCSVSHSSQAYSRRAMLSAQLIRRLLTRLSRALAVLTRVATLSARRLRTLLFYFRLFATKFYGLPRHSTVSKSIESQAVPESCTVLTSTGWCSHSTSPLPLHTRQITSATAANNTQAAAPPSTQSVILDRESLHENVVISDGSRIEFEFTPLHANNTLRYENRLPAYVVTALHHNSR